MARSRTPRRLVRAVVYGSAALMCAACGLNRSPAAERGLTPGDHEITIEHQGRSRRALVHVPPRTGAAPVPLVLAFHGGGGEPVGFRNYAGLDAIADRENFMVVYPFGSGVLPRRLLTWNAGTGCCGYALDRNIDDVGFAIALIDRVAQLASVDARRVYATGHSNGSMMAHRLAAQRADRIAAIAPVAGALDLDAFAPARPVPVLHIHSVDDPRALYNGGLGPPFPMTDRRVPHKPVLEGLERWAAHNGCTGELAIVELRQGAAGTVNAGQSATRLAHPSCSGAPVEHWRMTGVGHGWPGGASGELPASLIGQPTTLVDAAAEAWAFFRRFTR